MILTVLKTVFSEKKYTTIAFLVAVILFIISTWIPNLKLIFTIFTSSGVTLSEKSGLLVNLTGSIGTNFTLFSASYTALIAILFGINIAMLIFFMKKRNKFLQQSGVASLGGLVSGIFGIGCAACGSVVLTPLLTLVGVGGVLVYLPFGGREFGILGIVVLSFSIFLTAKKINKPSVCGEN